MSEINFAFWHFDDVNKTVITVVLIKLQFRHDNYRYFTGHPFITGLSISFIISGNNNRNIVEVQHNCHGNYVQIKKNNQMEGEKKQNTVYFVEIGTVQNVFKYLKAIFLSRSRQKERLLRNPSPSPSHQPVSAIGGIPL